MKVLIVGAGMAGLVLGGLLRRRPGTEIVIIERAARFEDLSGFAIGLYPMGARVMHGLGVYGLFEKQSRLLSGYAVHDDEGKLVRKDFSIGDLIGTMRCIGRDELVGVLREGLSVGGGCEVDMRMGVTVEAINERADKVRVKFNDEKEEEFDLVVGADGVHSQVANLCFKPGKVYDPGWGGWVWWTKLDESGEAGLITENWGLGRFIGFYPTDRRLCVAAFGPNHEIEVTGEGRKEKVNRYMGRLGEVYGDAMADMPGDDEHAVYWRLADCVHKKWHTKRVVLVGDAAAGIMPTAGAGASIAMESAAVLADELLRVDEGCVERALRLYEKRRRKKVMAMVRQSRKLARMMVKTSKWAMRKRFLFIRYMPSRLFSSVITRGMRKPI
ncbi:FAD-dependent oxidoreductase [Poriferisphaera sp. WC338]|uniref:FAD-dependent oxidoreductase n=1 Tax=Poriferisphaera sp. WC338 TaxID=3425129 RepID=UPI003D815354